MRLLLDTHVFLWLQTEPERLGVALTLVEDPANELLFSAASSWEIAIKHALGRLTLPDQPSKYVPDRMRAIGATPLTIEHPHVLGVADLPPVHRDPFDRLLVTQARLVGVSLVTADPIFERYDVDRIMVA